MYVSAGGVDNELHAMLLNMSPEEQKWLIRIVLKDISLGLSQNKILYLFHPDAVDLFDVSHDLRKVNTKAVYISCCLHVLLTIFHFILAKGLLDAERSERSTT